MRALRQCGIDFALLSTPTNVTYAAGFEAPLPIATITDAVLSMPTAMALVASDGDGLVIVADANQAAARDSWFARSFVFNSFGHFKPVNPSASFERALTGALDAAGLRGQRAVLGVEPSLARNAVEILATVYPLLGLRDVSEALEIARWTKTPREIELLSEAALVASAGQTALRTLAATVRDESTLTEIDVWAELRRAMETRAGRRLTVVGDLITGARTAVVGSSGPEGRQVSPGDIGLLDISPRVRGYWADCTNTVVFGAEPTYDQRRHFDAAREACEATIQVLRPGTRCCEVAEVARATMEHRGFALAHYAGHQIGAGINERPRLVPYEQAVIQAGMVFCVEPGAYDGDQGTVGARAEKTVLVTEDGPAVLSAFDWGL
jgi:Xaa-Pro aminopeptidase